MLRKTLKFSSNDFNSIRSVKPYKIFTDKGFFLVFNSDDLFPKPKKGIVLPKKHFKTAVMRNRYKRLFYNTVQEVQKENPTLASKVFLFFPKKPFTKEDLKIDLLSKLC